jgi:hypothetical protein
MVLSGILFSFDKMHDVVSAKGKVPIVADLMVSRWAYEAMAVHQFKENQYEAPYFQYDKAKAEADYKSSWLVDELREKNRIALKAFQSGQSTMPEEGIRALSVLRSTLQDESFLASEFDINLSKDLSPEHYSSMVSQKLLAYFSAMEAHYLAIFRKNDLLLEKKMIFMESETDKSTVEMKNLYFNENLSELVRNIKAKDVFIESNGKIYGQLNPIFQDHHPESLLDYRAPFFISEKEFAGIKFPTPAFNVLTIWFLSLLLYLMLYFSWLERLVRFLSRPKVES